ncbi:Retrovirus-related Pol polyprotein type-2 like protein [Argiope bruennichi]|uniref:Retrovirus-related Pol polyprotein type-2 like protein n=1 Tax=Argiope bruennichi TaxID=94029 RepID=A0A8T0FJ63_ARGBR|nr:Retrovirus-related Pol polyprotein type-2 like protein [Argiope bruennichi]
MFMLCESHSGYVWSIIDSGINEVETKERLKEKKLVEEKLLLLTSVPACPPHPPAPAASPVHVAPATALPVVPEKLHVPTPDSDVGPIEDVDEAKDRLLLTSSQQTSLPPLMIPGTSMKKPYPANVKSLLVSYLTTVLSPSHLGDKVVKKRASKKSKPIIASKRKAKKREFARLQALYKKNRSNSFNSLFDKSSISVNLESSDVFAVWSHLFTKSSLQSFASSISCFGPPSDTEIDCDLLIYPAEVLSARLPLKPSSGPDGVSVRTLNRIPNRVLYKVYSAFLLLRWVPGFLLDSRTIFIPKKHDSAAPSHLRPLSIASVVVPQFHKILATPLLSQVDPSLDDLQFGFRPKDGIRRLSTCLTTFFKTPVDVSALSLWLTSLCFQGQISPDPVKPTRGVRQGDPLSPLLLLLVFEEVLRSIPNYEGYVLHGRKINHIAYANDLVLVADSITGLNNIANKILPALHASGLNISIAKSSTISWKADGKNKQVIFDSKSTLLVRNRPVRSFRADENFKYLGVNFTPRGRVKFRTDLEERLNILAKSLPKQIRCGYTQKVLPRV